MDIESKTIKIKWYPWLNIFYKKLILRYQKNSGHHALLLHSCYSYKNVISLCYALIRWLMCKNPNDIKSCGICHSCKLMISGNHPDVYHFQVEKFNKNIGINFIREIIKKINICSNQDGLKVIWILNVERLTTQATNALLKTIEEPPKKTFFILTCKELFNLLPTLKSRCLYLYIKVPPENLGLKWLYKLGYNNIIKCITAIRLCGGAPDEAEILLKPENWLERSLLHIALENILKNGNFLKLLKILNNNKINFFLNCLLTLFVDSIKWKYNAKNYLINVDSIYLISLISYYWSNNRIYLCWKQIINCLKKLKEIDEINKELILTYYLLKIEKILINV